MRVYTLLAGMFGVTMLACDQPLEPARTSMVSTDIYGRPSTHDVTPPAFTARMRLTTVNDDVYSVEWEVTSAIATNDLEVDLAAPEVTLAERNGWSPEAFQIITREKIPPVHKQVFSARSNSRLDGQTKIRVSAPGLYQIVLTAKARDLPEVVGNRGRRYHNYGHLAMFLAVAQDSASLVEQPMFAVYPQGVIRTIGPFRHKTPAQPLPETLHGPAATRAGDGQQFRVVYFDTDADEYMPLPRLRVDFEEWDTYENVLRGSYYFYTDDDGTFWGMCPDDYYTVDTFMPRFSGTWVHMNQGWIASPQLSGAWCEPSPTPIDVLASGDEAHVYRQLTEAAASSQDIFGYGMPLINVAIGTSNATDTATGSVTVASVWGSYGRAAQSHEYGHSLHVLRLGGAVHSSGDCTYDQTYPHDYNQVQSLRCAIGEGFASFHSAVVMPSNNWLLPAIEIGTLEDLSSLLVPNGTDGSLIPHAVAGFLLDLADDTPQEEDIAYPPQYIAQIIHTCSVTAPWYRAGRYSGVDDVIWCMEGQVDGAITSDNSFFTTRSVDATFIAESATEPNDPNRQLNVRSLWMANLYPWK